MTELVYFTLVFIDIPFIILTNMKKHFISLFDSAHRKRTIALFVIAALFIVISSLVGIGDNLPVIALFLTGIVLLFFSDSHHAFG